MSVTFRVLDWVSARLQKKAEKKADQIRTIRENAQIQEQHIIEIKVYEMDVVRRAFLPQESRSYKYRFSNGVAEPLRPDVSSDITIYTDFPTLEAVATGRRRKLMPNGTHVVERFTVRDALRLGYIDYDGNLTALRYVNLLQERILPALEAELKDVWPHITPH